MSSPNPKLGAELRANLKLALPLIAAQLAGVGMTFIDTVFAGRLGARALAAVAVGTNFNVLFFVLFMGVFMACSPVVSHMVGARRPSAAIGAFIRRVRRFAWLVALLWLVSVNLTVRPALTHIHLEPETAELAVRFVRALSGSAFGMSLWFTLRFSAEGLGHTRPVFYAGLVGLAGNTALDWLLLFGHFGLPRLGAVGCGVATTIAALAMACTLDWQFRRHPGLREVALAKDDGEPAPGEDLREVLRVGVPIGLILLAEAGLFVLVTLLMPRFGDATVGAYQVALNFAAVMFMIPLGVALGTTVRVGHAAGAGERAAARYRGFVGMGMGLGNAASNAAVMVLFGGLIAAFYTEDAGIAAQAAHFLLLAAFFQFFDGLQVTANGALRGIKDTRLPMLITLVAYWLVGLPVAWWLAFSAGGSGIGPDGLWWGLTAGLGVAAIGLTLRFTWETRAGAKIRSELMA